MNAIGNQQNGFSDDHLKNYTLDLCQDIDAFMADRDFKKPVPTDYNASEYKIASHVYEYRTIILFVKNFSVKITNCCSEFEKRRFSINPMLKSGATNPKDILVITTEIIPSLHSLANQL